VHAPDSAADLNACSALLECFPKENYHAASKVSLIDASHPDVVVIQLDNGERIAGHLLVAADG
jgi:2-polyprenyl-6-methoxyphenol hydroxylase-like FAD-dependent oxidoreductase